MPADATTIAPPRFVHDCNGCVHIGSDAEHDYYYCAKAESDMGGSIIARSGDEGPDYASCPVSIIRIRLESARSAGDTIPSGPTVRGLHLAEQRGVVTPLAMKTEPPAFVPAACPGCTDCVESWD
jgi:hypothetical protein